ncbi:MULTISPECIES: SAM-dependent methyltransferase [unclassified Kribbella]|uniref:SAM-dependent methyltransferase n=1 Tax=unclassified Kribbella TaxID=2644121 RepID=UPI0030194301
MPDDARRSTSYHRAADAANVDVNRPSDARLYDLFLGGKNNFEADRLLHQALVRIAPEAPRLASENRRWLAEAVDLMIREGGIDQFLDLGSGLPTTQNLHEVALRSDPGARVVYVDNDLTAISHGQALLADDQHAYFADADLTDPAAVFRHPVVSGALDLDRPVGIILGLVLHLISDTDRVRRIVADYLAAVPSGSWLAITHPLNPRDGSRLAGFSTSLESKLKDVFPDVRFRTADEIEGLLTGLDVVEPGLVDLATWWPPEKQNLGPSGTALLLLVAVARKP